MILPLSNITLGRNHARGGRPPRRVKQLAASIRETGWIDPVVVRDLGHGEYELVAGFRRFAAAQLLGLDSIPVQVVDADSDAFEINLAENLREDVHPIDRGLSWQQGINRGKRLDELAAVSGVSVGQISRLTSALRRLHPDVIEHYRERECTQALLIGLSYQSEAKQLRSLTCSNNPQKTGTRKRARRSQDIRVAMREIRKQPRTKFRDTALEVLAWVLRERDELTL